MNATLAERSSGDRLVDIAARVIAFAAAGLFWWIWLTGWLDAVVVIAGSRSVDASPAALLAGAAVAATILLGIGLLLVRLLFTATHSRVRRAMVFIRGRWRSIGKVILGTVIVIVACFAALLGFSAVLVAYALGLAASWTLFLDAAEQVNAVEGTTSFAALAGIGAALVRTYLALAILGVEIGVTYVGGRWVVRSGQSAQRGSL